MKTKPEKIEVYLPIKKVNEKSPKLVWDNSGYYRTIKVEK